MAAMSAQAIAHGNKREMEERNKQNRLMDLHQEFLSLLEVDAHSDDENEENEQAKEGNDEINQEEVKEM